LFDDVREQTEITTEMLQRVGYSATSRSSGVEAVDYMRNNSADLLLIDMIMDPGIDGLETHKRILQLHARQRAIVMTGYSETQRVSEVQRLGAGPYVRKPYTLNQLSMAVSKALEK
jgi:CheY-like chemotaxis protein